MFHPVSGQLSTGRPGEDPVVRPTVSCCLSTAGIRFLDTLSRREFRPHYCRPTARSPLSRPGRTHDAGFTRSPRVRRGPGGAPSVSRGRRCSLAIGASVAIACRFATTSPCHPGTAHPTRDVSFSRHQQGFPGSRPSGPSPGLWPPWLGRRPLSVDRRLRTRPVRNRPRTLRQGRVRTQTRSYVFNMMLNLLDELTHYVRPRVAKHLGSTRKSCGTGRSVL
jgi:hypothetical protein